MLMEKNSSQSFLNKMTVLNAKGWVLHLDLTRLGKTLSEQKKSLLMDLLQDFHNKRTLVLLDNPDSNDIFLFFQENRYDDIQTLLVKIAFLLELSLNTQENKQDTFYSIYNLSEDWQSLRQMFSKNDISIKEQTSLPQSDTKQQNDFPFNTSFTPALLGQIEKNLSQTDLASLMRRQSVCAVVGSNRPVELFEKIYVPLSDLKKSICPTVDICESPWLLDKLLETLDKRVLENISHHDSGAFCKNFSVNISVNTLLTPDFDRFNKSLDDDLKNSILLEIRQSDIFKNVSAFLVAKSYILNEGFRLCVDVGTSDALSFIDKKTLNASYLKLGWSEDLSQQSENTAFLEALKKNNPENIILSDVDSAKAIEWGQKLGINIFQGYYVQKLLYQVPRTKRS